jgi:hypothetical protein
MDEWPTISSPKNMAYKHILKWFLFVDRVGSRSNFISTSSLTILLLDPDFELHMTNLTLKGLGGSPNSPNCQNMS